MEPLSASILPPGLLDSLGSMPLGDFTLPGLLALVTASLVALSVPGAVNTMSFVSGMMLGLAGILVVALGCLVGSHLLYLATRRWLGKRMRKRFGAQLERVNHHLARRGPIYVVGARLLGVPSLLVTAGCAATRLRARTFLAASLLGMLPAITLAAMAGSAL